MPKDCIVRSKANELKQAFRTGEISIDKIWKATSEDRVKMLSKYVGESAKMTVARFEKAFLVPKQKIALRNAVFAMFDSKPLYVGVTLSQAQAMKDNINIRSLRKMTSEARTALLANYVDDKVATQLNKRYEDLTTSGNLQEWERRTLGTDKIRADKRLKGAISKIEALDDLGALSPKDTATFMETLVEDKLGVTLTAEESQKLSELTNLERDAYDKMMELTDGSLTFENEDAIVDYFKKVQAVQDYSETLMPMTKSKIANMIFDTMRAFILASPRILKNSMLYQGIPGVERAIVKRLVSGNMNSADMKSNIFEKMQAKLSGIKPSKESASFIKNQTAFAVRLYHKTGFDISRMENLSQGQTFFGEKVGRAVAKSWGESVGVQEKIGSIMAKIARKANLAPKWLAGGTDTLFANIGRADTATMMSREMANMEKRKGQLPEGMTEEQRADQLIKDSYKFDPKDPKAILIRNSGITDAHRMNNTQPDGMADKVIGLRALLKVGNLDFGKVIIPFAKIATTTISEGFQVASGYGIGKSIVQINNASKIENIETRSEKMYEGVNNLIRYVGFTGAVILIASLFDDDDYVAPYAGLSYKEYAVARARGSNAGMVRIGGKWIPLRYLPIINIPLSAIMSARQARAKGNDAIAGYVSGLSSQLMETPGIKEGYEFLSKKLARVASSKDLKKITDAMGFKSDNFFNWIKVRVMPSVLSYDLYNVIVPKDARYDFLGREIESTGFSGFKDDKTNDILLEFNRLNKTGNMPVVFSPKGDHLASEIAMLQRKYAHQVGILIKSQKYNNLSNENKKKEINKIRSRIVLRPLKNFIDRVKSLGVTNGERSKYLWEKISSMGMQERKAFYLDMRDKGIISKEVKRQLKIRARRKK